MGKVLIIILVVTVLSSNIIMGTIKCHSRWKVAHYGILTGCMVGTVEGSFVPESTVRVYYWEDAE